MAMAADDHLGTPLLTTTHKRDNWFMEKFQSNRAGLKALLVGQIVSLLLTCTGWTSSIIVHNGIHAPMLQSFLTFTLFTIVYGSILLYRGKPVQISWYWYLLLAIIDIESTFIGLKAYQYTSITSVMLLDCWTIPCVLFLTWQFLNTRYHSNHFVGVAICMAGLVVVIFSDVHSGERVSSGSDVLLGDSLVLLASTCYAIMNVSEEFVVKRVDQVEFLAHVGFFGMVISGCQFMVLESKQLESIDWRSVDIMLPFVAFAFSCLAFSSLVPWVLQMHGAAMLNLSLLTSDMWAVAVRALGFNEAIDGLYFVAFGLVALGLVVYASAGDIPDADFLAAPETLKYSLIEQPEKVYLEP